MEYKVAVSVFIDQMCAVFMINMKAEFLSFFSLTKLFSFAQMNLTQISHMLHMKLSYYNFLLYLYTKMFRVEYPAI